MRLVCVPPLPAGGRVVGGGGGERNVETEEGQTEGMKKDDWSRWI